MTILETSLVETEFGEVRVADQAGSHDGPPLVFVHGYPDNLQIWSKVFSEPRLQSRRLIAFDWPGLGHSSSYVGGATPFHLGRHFIAVLDGLGIDRAIPVGFDMGAHAVVSATAASPDRIAKLVLTNFLADGEVATSWEIDVMRRLGLNRLILQWAPRIVFRRATMTFLKETQLTADVKSDMWSGFSTKDSLSHIAKMCAGYQASLPRVTALFPRLEGQVEIFWATSDSHFPVAQGNAVASSIPNASMALMQGASHWFMWERPGEFAALLANSLDESGLE